VCRVLLGGAADFADQGHDPGFRVLLEELKDLNETGSQDRVATDADAGRLSQTSPSQLVHHLIGQGPAARHKPYGTTREDSRRHDSQLAPFRRNQPRAVGSQQAGSPAQGLGAHLDHVVNRHALGDADHQGKPGLQRLQTGVGGRRGRDEDQRGVGPGSLDCFGNTVKDRQSEDLLPSPPGSHTGHHPGAGLDHLLGVEAAFLSGQALHQDSG